MKLFDNDIDLIGNKLSTINSKSKLQIVENTTIYIISITKTASLIISAIYLFYINNIFSGLFNN